MDAADADAVGAVHGEIFGDIRPASTMVVVAGLLDPRWRVEVEVDALVGPDTASETGLDLDATSTLQP